MKKLLIFLFLGMFLINFVSAELTSFDNVVYYDNFDKDVKIKNLFGLGTEYADLKITSHEDLDKPIYVGTGWQRVITQEIKGFEDYNNFIGTPKFKNMKTGKYEELDYYWEKAIYGEVEVNEYEEKCYETNKTGDAYCDKYISGNHKEIGIVSWEKFEIKDIKKGEKLTIALNVFVNKGDHYDGIPELFGKKIDKWAEWENPLTDTIGDFETVGGTSIEPQGYVVYIKGTENKVLLNVTKSSSSEATRAYLYKNVTGSFPTYITNTSFVDNVATFSTFPVLELNNYYLILAGNEGNSYGFTYKAGATYPLNKTNIDVMYLVYTLNSSDYEIATTQYRNIENITTGDEIPTLKITIINPTATTYTTNTHDLNYTFTNNTLMDSCWYSLDSGDTNSSREDCGVNWSSLTASEGSNIWKIYGNTTDGTLTNSSVTFTVDTINPYINIEYPTGTIDYTASGYEIELNFTATDTSLDTCWYEYDNKNTTISCTSGVKTNINFTLTEQNNMTVYANDSVGRLGSNFTSWSANLQVNNLTYNINVSETSRQTFEAEFELLDTAVTAAQLIYNNETYPISTLSFDGNNLTLSKSIDIPVNYNDFTEQTSNFSFRFNYVGDVVMNTEKFYQNVTYINLQLCNTSFNTQALNFTFYDEIKQQNIDATSNATNFESYFEYWIGGGDVKKTYSFQRLANSTTNNYQFCIHPYNSSTIFKTNSDIDYSATYFRENQYHLRNASLTNVSNDILLYLLSNDIATKFFLTFQQGVSLIDGATVTVQKYFTGLGSYQTVGILLTDDDGEATMWKDIDKQYKYSVVQDGSLRGVVERISSCSVAPCTKTIIIDTGSANVFESYYDVYSINVVSNLSFNSTTKMVEYTFLDTTGLANYFRLVVNEIQLNATGNTVCDTTSYSVSGTLTCNLSAYSNSEFTATTYISRSPELKDKILGIIISEDIIEGLGLIGVFLIMSLIIIIVFAGAVVTKGSPSGVLWFLGLGILVLKLAGLFPFTWITTTAILIIILFLISKIKT